MTTRAEILTPGRYASLPLAVMRRVDLTPTAKLVYMALLDRWRAGEPVVEASVGDLAECTGAGRTAVKQAVDALARARLVRVAYRPGRPAAFTLLSGSDSDQVGDKPTGSDSDHPPGRKATRTGSDSDHPIRKTLTPDTPPMPPEGGERAEVDALLHRIDAAHRQAFGDPLPASWRRRLRRAGSNGSRCLVERIDADVLRRARRWRREHKLGADGPGVVLKMLEHEAAERAERQHASAVQASRAGVVEADAAARAAEHERNLAYFQTLPEAKRREWTEKVRAGQRVKLPAETVTALAAARAWEAREG